MDAEKSTIDCYIWLNTTSQKVEHTEGETKKEEVQTSTTMASKTAGNIAAGTVPVYHKMETGN